MYVKSCFFLVFFLVSTLQVSANNEIEINVTVNVLQEGLEGVGYLIYESKNEINKRMLPIFIGAVFALLLIIFVLKKKSKIFDKFI
ncbi:hypothetical protein HQ533_01530 [Candidatus Woesearchaeota archaeon]|nr:hypothetical protein [Candidatus Woesearchaeota archaeon]